MKKIFLPLLLAALLILPGFAKAQSPEDMLEGLKDKIEIENAQGQKIDVIDYGEVRPWGNLTDEEATALQEILSEFTVASPTADDPEATKPIESLKDVKTFFQNSLNIDIALEPDQAIAELSVLVLAGIANGVDASSLTADKIRQIITEASNPGETQILSIAIAITKTMRNLFASLAAILIVIMGIQMVTSQGEEAKIQEVKTGITWTLIGLGIMLLAQPLIEAIYGTPGAEVGLIQRTELSRELDGLISFIKALLGGAAVAMIITAGFKTVAAQGDEEKMGQQKKAIVWIVIGLILVVINETVVDLFFKSPYENQDQFTVTTVKGLINVIGNLAQFALGFVGLIALGVMVYGGASYIMNFGDEEAAGKSKTMMTNAAIGIVIILSAFAIVRTLIVQLP